MAAEGGLIRLALIAVGASLVAGCGVVNSVIPKASEIQPSSFCTDMLQRAYPLASFDITKTEAHNTGMTTSVVDIKATRTDVQPTAEFVQDVGIECKFEHDVLTDFHWTAGPFK